MTAPSSLATAAARPTRSAVPLPSLKPGEVITWVKLERPKFALGEIIVSSLAFVGLVVLVALVMGMVLGHLKSKKTGAHRAGGLGLR